MHADDDTYFPRQLDAAIRLHDHDTMTDAPCVAVGVGRDGLLVRGGPSLPLGRNVQVTLMGDHRARLTIGCVSAGAKSGDQLLRFEGLSFDERASLEELIRPHWDGVDLFDGLMTMACLYGPSTLKDWLCMTSLLERLQPRVVRRPSHTA